MSNKPILIHRFTENPLITPKDVPWLKWYPKCWRSVFNCGVIYDENTKLFKMLFRGGTRLFSNLGYAESVDGIKWKVNPKPVLKFYNNFFWHCHTLCGIEDPRIVKWIDGYYYIFATAGSISYNLGTLWESPKGSLGIWKTKDFKNFEWVATPFGKEGKNAAIFPYPITHSKYLFKKIGQYEILTEQPEKYAHLILRKGPDIWIAKTKDLSLRDGWTEKKLLLSTKKVFCDRNGNFPTKIGIAGPPVKTPKGWLIVFHAKHGKGLSGKKFSYSLGFVVTALDDPTKIIYLHPSPILWPEKPEEKNGKVKNVVFSCATVDKGDDYIYIYWGAADTTVCGGVLRKTDLTMCY